MVIALLLCGVVLAACGGDGGGSKDEYKQGMRAVGVDISKASDAVADLPATANAPQRAAAIKGQQKAIAAAAARAKKLDPPSDAKGEHDKLVVALEDYAALLGQLSAASGDTAKEATLIGDAGPIVDRLGSASTALEKLGYDFNTDGKA